jgi:hypothetical protein
VACCREWLCSRVSLQEATRWRTSSWPSVLIRL